MVVSAVSGGNVDTLGFVSAGITSEAFFDTVVVPSSLRTVAELLLLLLVVVVAVVVERGVFRNVLLAVLEVSTFFVSASGGLPWICELSKLSSVYSSEPWLLPLPSSLLTDSSLAMSLSAVSSADQLPWADRSEIWTRMYVGVMYIVVCPA